MAAPTERAARLASEDARKQAREYLDLIRRSRLASRHAEADEYERNLLALFPPALPSSAGPDAETLAETVREGVSAAEVPLGVVSAAFDALSGLVALVEQRERERDDQRTRRYELAADATRKCTEFRERAEKAEALLTSYRQALEDIRDVPSERYLLHYPVAREMHEIALAALAASAPGTEDT